MSNQRLYEKVTPVEGGFPIKFALGRGPCYTHWHEYTELLCFLSDGKVLCNGKMINLSVGDVALINSTELHSVVQGDYYCLRVAPSFFADVQMNDIRLENCVRRTLAVTECFEKLSYEYETKTLGCYMEIKSLVYHLFRYLLTNHMAKEKGKRLKVDMVIEALGFIADHYTEKITTSAICHHLHVSENYFSNVFKQTVGHTPSEYVNKYRIEKAAELLYATGESITSVAMTVGIDDPNYFSRLFKRFMEATPREYRRSLEKANH